MIDYLNLVPRKQRLFTQSCKELSTILPRIEAELRAIPVSYDRDDQNPMVYAHYFFAACDWFITGHDVDDGLLYGFCILNGWHDSAEFGPIAISDLVGSKYNIELDYYFEPQRLDACLLEKGLKLVDWRLEEVG